MQANNFDRLAKSYTMSRTRRGALKALAGAGLATALTGRGIVSAFAQSLSDLGVVEVSGNPGAEVATIRVSAGDALACNSSNCGPENIDFTQEVEIDDYLPAKQNDDEVSTRTASAGGFNFNGPAAGRPLEGPDAYTNGSRLEDDWIASGTTGRNRNQVSWTARIPERYYMVFDSFTAHVPTTPVHGTSGVIAAIPGPAEYTPVLTDGAVGIVHERIALDEVCYRWHSLKGLNRDLVVTPEAWGENPCGLSDEEYQNEWLKPGPTDVNPEDGMTDEQRGFHVCEDGDTSEECLPYTGTDEVAVDGECVTFDGITPIKDRTLVCSGMTVAAGSVEYPDGSWAEGCWITLAEDAYVTDGVGASVPDDLQDDIDATLNGECVFASA